MLIAEIRRKLMDVEDFDADDTDGVEQLRSLLSSAKEDLLTADVFGVLKYLPADQYLQPLLSHIAEGQASGSFASCLRGLDFEAEDFIFRFWPNYPTPKGFPGMATEPDVELVGRSLRIFFEAKLHSGFGDFQIPRQLLIGLEQEDGRDFYLVLVTAGLSQPRIRFGRSRLSVTDYLNAVASGSDVAMTETQRRLLRTGAEKVLWTDWRHIARVLANTFETNEQGDTATRTARAATASMLGDLRELLLMRGLAPFQGLGISAMTVPPKLLRRFLPLRRSTFAGFESPFLFPPSNLPAGWLVGSASSQSVQRDRLFFVACCQSEIEPAKWRAPQRRQHLPTQGRLGFARSVADLGFTTIGLELTHRGSGPTKGLPDNLPLISELDFTALGLKLVQRNRSIGANSSRLAPLVRELDFTTVGLKLAQRRSSDDG